MPRKRPDDGVMLRRQLWTGQVGHAIIQFKPDIVRPGLAQTAATDAELAEPIAPIKDTRATAGLW